MVTLILLIIGIVALFKESMAISKKFELRRPKIRIFGVITIVSAIILILSETLSGTDLGLLIYLIFIIIPIITAVKLKQPKLQAKQEEKK